MPRVHDRLAVGRPIAAALAGLFAGCHAAGPSDPAPATDLTWQHVDGESLALVRAGETVWRLHFGPERAKPCFHPLTLPGGRELTLDQPGDHRWHHGLWFSWKYLNGVNYWENEAATGRPAGLTSWRVTALEPQPDGSARIVLAVRYAPDQDAAMLTEERTLSCSQPAADGTFHIDWHSQFTAQQACKLDRTPLPGEPGGKPYGGYAGLSLRLAQLQERDALVTAADTGPTAVVWNAQERFRGRATAFDYRGVLDGQEVGIAILDHPDNDRTPSPWYAIRSSAMTFFTPAVLCYGALELAAGDRFELRYRVVVHPGRWSGAQLTAAADDFARTRTAASIPKALRAPRPRTSP